MYPEVTEEQPQTVTVIQVFMIMEPHVKLVHINAVPALAQPRIALPVQALQEALLLPVIVTQEPTMYQQMPSVLLVLTNVLPALDHQLLAAPVQMLIDLEVYVPVITRIMMKLAKVIRFVKLVFTLV